MTIMTQFLAAVVAKMCFVYIIGRLEFLSPIQELTMKTLRNKYRCIEAEDKNENHEFHFVHVRYLENWLLINSIFLLERNLSIKVSQINKFFTFFIAYPTCFKSFGFAALLGLKRTPWIHQDSDNKVFLTSRTSRKERALIRMRS